MLARRFPTFAALPLVAALALSGCMTPPARPKASQAVMEARAHRNVQPPPACEAIPLSAVSPISAGFAFESGELSDLTRPDLDRAITWLACHPATTVVIKPEADNHGEAQGTGLALTRGQAVLSYLQAHGVAANRIQLLPRGQDAPAGEHVLILAEGRRW